MAPITDKNNTSWKEVNKARKEKRKKRNEEKLIKKAAKEAVLESEAQEAQAAHATTAEKHDLATVSIALPGSILENAQSSELRTYLAGQIARAACVFQVDEIIVFDDYSGTGDGNKRTTLTEEEGVAKTTRRSCAQLGRLLQYLECPQYLRKHFFPLHKDLQYAGILNPLDSPHHLRQDNEFAFREGVVTNKPVKEGRGSLVNVGLLQCVTVDKLLTPGIRCTVKLIDPSNVSSTKKLKGVVVSPNVPRAETGVYWGYSVRLADSLSQVFTKASYESGYDLTIGTSDKGTSVDEFRSPANFKHALIVFGGVQGLESALDSDEKLNVDEPSLLFDEYLNTLPGQGSRTIRTEEAVLITLAALRPKLNVLTGIPTEVLAESDASKMCVNQEMNVDVDNADDMSRFDE